MLCLNDSIGRSQHEFSVLLIVDIAGEMGIGRRGGERERLGRKRRHLGNLLQNISFVLMINIKD